MHDWTLVSIHLDWDVGALEISLLDETSAKRCLRFERLRDVSIGRAQPWGPSESINAFSVLKGNEDSALKVKIEMQSGDELNVVAGSCMLDDVRIRAAPGMSDDGA